MILTSNHVNTLRTTVHQKNTNLLKVYYSSEVIMGIFSLIINYYINSSELNFITVKFLIYEKSINKIIQLSGWLY